MSTTYEHPEPQQFMDAPLYFERIWDTTGIPPVEQVGDVTVVTPQVGRLTIYGYSTHSPFQEDLHIEKEWWRHGSFPAICFSPMEPQGEFGSVPLVDVTEITKEQFEHAQKKGWRP